MSSDIAAGSWRYHVAVDFGTHGTGFAYWAKSSTDNNPHTYENWSSQRGLPAPKTRTALLYRTSDLSKPQAWGWEAVTQYSDLPQDERGGFLLLESFKKYLMPQDFTDLPQLPANITTVKLVSDFLRCLYNDAILPTLKDHYGARFHPSAVRWCLTVPAGLSQSSMALMRRAAMAAGLIPSADSPALLLTSEPEAAALTAQQRKDLPGQALVAGGRMMLIDMGGGTVDMTIHDIDSLAGGDAMSMSEATHRECLAEGATRFDERFRTHLGSILGPDACTDWAKDPANAAELQELLYDEWETCKCVFAGGPGATATHVNLPYSLVFAASDEGQKRLEATGHTDRLVLSPSTLEGFFRPSLSSIISTAQAMLSRSGGADVIVLVGGFSGSRFVRRELAAALERHGMPVVAPAYGATAVLEGGVWFSRYPSAIAARRSCMSYGIRAAVPWSDDAPDRTWLQHKQAFRCLHGFVPYVKRDELVRAGSVITKIFTPLYPNQSVANFHIYGCLNRSARFTTSPTMTKIATVRVEFPPCASDPESYILTAEFSFGETQINVRCVDEQTGQDTRTELLFDSTEALGDNMVAPAG